MTEDGLELTAIGACTENSMELLVAWMSSPEAWLALGM